MVVTEQQVDAHDRHIVQVIDGCLSIDGNGQNTEQQNLAGNEGLDEDMLGQVVAPPDALSPEYTPRGHGKQGDCQQDTEGFVALDPVLQESPDTRQVWGTAEGFPPLVDPHDFGQEGSRRLLVCAHRVGRQLVVHLLVQQGQCFLYQAAL